MLGSTFSISGPNIVLNTIVAESLASSRTPWKAPKTLPRI
jgi:glutamine synthetase type III